MSDETTKRIGDYEILKELGAGGMGKVYQVRNVITDRIEAMKVLLPTWPRPRIWRLAFCARSSSRPASTIPIFARFEPHSRTTTACTW